MKNYQKYYIIAVLLPVFFSILQKGLLDVSPPDRLSTAVFWKSEADADLALTGLYNFLYATGGNWACQQYEVMGWDNYTDDFFGKHDYGGGYNATSSGITPTQEPMYSVITTIIIGPLRLLIRFLANVDKVLPAISWLSIKEKLIF